MRSNKSGLLLIPYSVNGIITLSSWDFYLSLRSNWRVDMIPEKGNLDSSKDESFYNCFTFFLFLFDIFLGSIGSEIVVTVS